jgi:hypothetical protein
LEHTGKTGDGKVKGENTPADENEMPLASWQSDLPKMLTVCFCEN